MKPEFVDNRDGNTLVEALRGHLDWLHETFAQPVEVAIASGYFNPEGFFLIADQLERLPRVRLLIGAEPTPTFTRPQRKPGDPRGERYDAEIVRRALKAHSQGLRQDRDLLGFTREVDAPFDALSTSSTRVKSRSAVTRKGFFTARLSSLLMTRGSSQAHLTLPQQASQQISSSTWADTIQHPFVK